MFIKRLTITNFKSFEDLDIELGKFNILIGANAAGKTNFIKIFDFLRNIANYGLEDAISMAGGVEFLKNTKIGADKDLAVKIVYGPERGQGLFSEEEEKNSFVGAKIEEAVYEFMIHFYKKKRKGADFKITQDNLTLNYKFTKLEKQNGKLIETDPLGTGEVILCNTRGKVTLEKNLPEDLLSNDFIFPLSPILSLSGKKLLSPLELLLETPFFSLAHQFDHSLRDIALYDIDPRLAKKAVSITGKTELEENGSNLSIVLKRITENEENKRKFLNLMRDLLPFISDVQVQKLVGKSLFFALREEFLDSTYLPASFISEGTINIIALIIILYFENKPLVIIEEPGRNIHPHLISRAVKMFEEVSEEKQIIITTHNPEFVKYANPENLLLVARDANGFSTVSRPGEREEIKVFLKNEIGIDELYTQNLLGVTSGA